MRSGRMYFRKMTQQSLSLLKPRWKVGFPDPELLI